MRSIFFKRDSPADTTLYDSSTNEVLYTVATQHDEETITRVQNADGEVIASWVWKEIRSDIITLGSSKPISVSTWLDKNITPNQDTVTLTDHLKRKFKWKGNAPGTWSLELYSESDKKPIVKFRKSHTEIDPTTGNKTVEPARLDIDGLALEIQDIVVISFLVLEKTRRHKGASQMNLAEGSKTGFVGQYPSELPYTVPGLRRLDLRSWSMFFVNTRKYMNPENVNDSTWSADFGNDTGITFFTSLPFYLIVDLNKKKAYVATKTIRNLTMLWFILQNLLLIAVLWLGWRLARRYLLKNDVKNVPGPPVRSFLKGNFDQVFNVNGWEYSKKLAQEYGSVVRIDAALGDTQLYVSDPLALHHIVVKDQNIYEETDGFIHSMRLFFGHGLLGTLGEQHRKQRKMLSPVFSIAHMRDMVPIFYDVIHKLEATIARDVQDGPKEIDLNRWMARTALELIGQSGLGWSFDSLEDETDSHPFSRSVKQLIPASFPLIFIRTYFLSTLVKIGTPRFRRFVVDCLPFYTSLRRVRDIVDVIENTSVEIYETKKKAIEAGDEAVEEQVGAGKDILSILLRANMEASEEDRLPESEVLAQLSTFTFAAMDTTSNALSRILHLLAMNPDTQNRLREEINEASQEGDMTYDQLNALPYLDAVCRETLRLYPPIVTVQRTTRAEVVMPLSTPIRGVDGREMTQIVVPNNTNIIVSIINANRNTALWGPDSYEWKPERWLSAPPETVVDAHMPGIYSHIMTFLGGGRACIGFKFSQLEMKVVLCVLLSRFKFSPPKTKEIYWEMTNIVQPTVKGVPHVPQMPLVVQAV